MKQKIRSITALILCAMLFITGIISTETDSAYAAGGKLPVKVTFNKKPSPFPKTPEMMMTALT